MSFLGWHVHDGKAKVCYRHATLVGHVIWLAMCVLDLLDNFP